VDASPYINHPIEVATILATRGGITDLSTLMAAVLHDTIEDTETSPEELEARFGPEVRALVLEVTDDKHLSKAERKRLQICMRRFDPEKPRSSSSEIRSPTCGTSRIPRPKRGVWKGVGSISTGPARLCMAVADPIRVLTATTMRCYRQVMRHLRWRKNVQNLEGSG